jgi:hypothetical protein
VLGTPGVTDTGVVEQLTASNATYVQEILQNINAAATASTDFVVNNNLGTATTYYGDFGMNSSAFTGTGSYNLANAVYVSSTSGDLVLATTTANAIHLVVNGAASDALAVAAPSLALPSGASTAGANITLPAQTFTVTGTNTATAFQANYFGVPTITNASAGVATDLFNTVFAGPAAVAGSQTATRAHTLGVIDATSASSSIIGAFVVATAFGTAATSVAIGGGNVYAGGIVYGNQLESLVATGTAPLVVTSTTQVTNLNSSQLVGATWVSPGTIGSTTKNTGAFTTLTSNGATTFTAGTASTTTGTGTLVVTGGIGVSGQLSAVNIRASSSAGTIGFIAATGAGGAVTQLTSRTTGVTLSTPTGQITLFAAAGTTTPATFTVTNTVVAATDVIALSQTGGSNQYIAFATAAAGSFNITFYAMVGTASDSPIFNFVVLKGAAS